MAELGHMSARELTEWAVFEEEFGPLTLHKRIDALIQATTGQAPQWVVQRPVEITDWLHAMSRRH